jgi:hypothetical protein
MSVASRNGIRVNLEIIEEEEPKWLPLKRFDILLR